MNKEELKTLAILLSGKLYGGKIYIPAPAIKDGTCCEGCVAGSPGSRLCNGLIHGEWSRCEDKVFVEFKP